jgi:hypothetical protein
MTAEDNGQVRHRVIHCEGRRGAGEKMESGKETESETDV